MSVLDSLFLGLIQGITEFLPVSSTGHLIIARDLLGLESEFGLAVDATLHFATALAVLLYFRKDIADLVHAAWLMARRQSVAEDIKTLLYALIVATIPAVVAGLLLEDLMDTIFRSAVLVSWVLIAGSGLFLLAEYLHKRYQIHGQLTVRKGALVGLFQVLALIPGMSRSGATISGGMILGLTREQAARFAFLLSLPLMLGAGSKKLLELSGAGVPESEWLLIGFAAFVAFASGLAAIHYLLKFLRKHTLGVFIIYRIALAAVVLLSVS